MSIDQRLAEKISDNLIAYIDEDASKEKVVNTIAKIIEAEIRPLVDELKKADSIITKLKRLVKHYGWEELMPNLRRKQRSKLLEAADEQA